MKTILLAFLVGSGLFSMAQNFAPLSVFPNPATDYVYVQVPATFTGITYIYVSDLKGKIYASVQQNFDAYDNDLYKRVKVALQDIPDGYYVINIRNEKDWRAMQFSKSPVTYPQ